MNTETILIKALQLIFSLSLLVVLHEGGHFGFAKLFKVKVEKFYMFFNYKFHVFSTRDKWFTRLFPRFKNNETEYGIGWIPLGGYVSIAGMVDETKGAKEVGEPQPGDFSTKPVWQRFFIMFGGVLMNFITALVLYSIIMFTWGQDVLPIRNVGESLVYNEQAQSIGFKNGDLPVAVDGNEIIYWTPNIYRDISNASEVTVLRGNSKVTIVMPENGVNMIEMMEQPRFFDIGLPTIVGEVIDDSPSACAGVRNGDRIVALDDYPVENHTDVQAFMQTLAKDNIHLVVLHKGAEVPDTMDIYMDASRKMGIAWDTTNVPHFETEHLEYGLLESVPAGCSYAWETMCNYVNDLKYVPTKKGAQSIGSFLTIGSIFPASWDWQCFWFLTAFLSIVLAVMNILPIPGLDGGHIVLLIYEGITGKQPSPRVMEIIERVGMGILICLMLLAFGNDIVRFFL